MATKPKNTIADLLTSAQVAIVNSLADDEIKSLVAVYGYSETKLNEGKALHTAAVSAVNAAKAAAGAQRVATAQLISADRVARKTYEDMVKIARASLTPAERAALHLPATTPHRIADFLQAANTAFTNLGELLGDYGYDVNKITSDQAKITALDDVNDQQEEAKGAAQQATREQDAALDALNRWRAQYVKIAKVALSSKPELLEKIGVLKRSQKTAAQRAAPKKAAETRAKHKSTPTP